jgi:hypothetical protein
MAKLAKKAKIPEGIAAKRKGKPTGFVSASAEYRTHAGAMAHGSTAFNSGTHLGVDVPDDSFTVSCRSSDGRRITFAFLP